MKVLMDILTPKQARFFSRLGERLRSKGVGVSYTSRRYYESDRMIELLGIDAVKLGRWGETPYKKALFSAQRTGAYLRFLTRAKPDLVFSFGSPEAARASFGLGIPHMMASDSPHSEAVSRLTIPISRKLFTPWVIPRKAWARYGIAERDVVQYKGLDQAAWMKGFVVEEFGPGSKDRPILVYRPEEYRAAYVGADEPSTASFVRRTLQLLRAKFDQEVIAFVLGRYGRPEMYRRLLGSRVEIPRDPVDGVDLLRRASVFLGYGGTMTGEAALSGVLAISLSRRPNLVEEFLVRKGLVFKPSSPSAAAELISSFLRDERWMRLQRRRASELLAQMEDPTETICSALIEWAH
jgi:hypothetical protein